MKYKINEITPKEMFCIGGLGCPSIYNSIKEVTSEEMYCVGGLGCPSIYEGLRELTPEKIVSCGVGACPSSYEATKEGKKVYLIVGKLVNPSDAGLEKRVGEGEALIEIPRELIDNRRK